MFDLENILVYANSNIQIIGIFIAIIGGLVASKLLNAKIERDTLEEKLNRIIKEIEFNTLKKSGKENRIYLKKKEDYMYYIHDKIIEEDFDISNYDDYDLTKIKNGMPILKSCDKIGNFVSLVYNDVEICAVGVADNNKIKLKKVFI